MIDTHAHLNFPLFLKKINQIINQSQKAGVKAVIIASSNLKDSQKAVNLAKKHPHFLFASVGIHPQNTLPQQTLPPNQQLNLLDQLLAQNSKQIVAIGETGLDFSPPPPGEKQRTIEEQETLFLGQINLSLKYRLPLIIHAREANDEVLEILQSLPVTQQKNLKGVFHCYSAGRKRVQKILNLPGSWYFGFDGNLTYDEGLQNIITTIPPERILIETDSPFLAPLPFRNQTNTPANLPLIQKKINEIFQKDLTSQIFQNTLCLFSSLSKTLSQTPH